jgi:NAD(P)-dependent dehydrogenase (short-subunit alcohol dehydrogenase family)
MELGIAGKVALVTGASRGIGLATAVALAREGARVVLTARGERRLAAAVDACRAEGAEAEAVTVDLFDPDAGSRLLEAARERFGGLDALVNNAGMSAVRSLEELTDEEWQAQWELHVMAPMRLMRLAAPHMAERGGGRIVNVSSSSGKRMSLTNAAYSVTKAAELALSRAFADAWASRGVLVNAVTPGPIGDELWLGEGGLADQHAAAQGVSREEALASTAAKTTRGRLGRAEEVADVIVFLCSERAANVAGAAWSVDGGVVPLYI